MRTILAIAAIAILAVGCETTGVGYSKRAGGQMATTRASLRNVTVQGNLIIGDSAQESTGTTQGGGLSPEVAAEASGNSVTP